MTQRNKQARQTFHCFILNSHFIQPSECKYVLFVCVFVRLQVSFIPLHFRYFGRRFSLRTIDLSTESRCATHSTIFAEKTRIIFRGCCRPRKLKSAKNNPHVFQTKSRKFGDAKISHYTGITTYLTSNNFLVVHVHFNSMFYFNLCLSSVFFTIAFSSVFFSFFLYILQHTLARIMCSCVHQEKYNRRKLK